MIENNDGETGRGLAAARHGQQRIDFQAVGKIRCDVAVIVLAGGEFLFDGDCAAWILALALL